MAGGGGAWKVAYADFVTAMMAFFMVMWLTSQKPEVKEAVSEYFRNPSGRKITGNPHSSVLPSRQDSSGGKRVRTRGKEPATGQTKMTDEGKRTNIGTIVKFDENSVELNEDARKQLEEMIPELKGKPHRIEVRGHALGDHARDDAVSTEALEISYRRSLAAMAYLVEQGIQPQRIRLSQSGASEPRFIGQQIDTSSNARVEVYLLEETYEPPSEKVRRLISSKKNSKDDGEEEANESNTPHSLPAESKPASKPKPAGGH